MKFQTVSLQFHTIGLTQAAQRVQFYENRLSQTKGDVAWNKTDKCPSEIQEGIIYLFKVINISSPFKTKSACTFTDKLYNHQSKPAKSYPPES